MMIMLVLKGIKLFFCAQQLSFNVRSGNAKIMEGLFDQIFDAFCVMAVNALKTKNDVNDVSYSTSEALDATMHDYYGYVTMAD